MSHDTPVGKLMNPNVVCARPEMSIRDAEGLLSERGITGCPVVDQSGRPVGVISQFDLIAHQADRTTAGASGRFYSDVEDYQDLSAVPVDTSATPVHAVMSQNVVSVDREASVGEAARLMRDRRIHRLLVTDRSVLVGIVSSLDLLAVLAD